MSYTGIADSFWRRVRTGPGCWEWLGGHSKDGYGAVVVDGRQVKAHRRAYELLVGPIPEGLFVCHHCDNKGCVRPDHLYAGTAQQNSQDAYDRGLTKAPWTGKKRPDISGENAWQRRHPEKQVRGERSHLAKLTEDDIRRIREMGGTVRQVDIAQAFGIHQTAVSAILRRRTWSHVA